jgi:DNA-binding GntR family transcriptional regulator
VAGDPSALTVPDGNRLRDEVCERLRDSIIEGRLLPGHRLVERRLAMEFGVSRVPVREAIQVLISEGFVEALSARRIVVKQVSERDVRELFSVREALEVQAAKEATARADAEGLRELHRLLEEARAATESGQPDRMGEANVAFHNQIVVLADNRLLAALLHPLEGRLRWLFRQVQGRAGLWEEHHELYQAIASGDVEAAAACSLAHVQHYRTIALRLLYGVTE